MEIGYFKEFVTLAENLNFSKAAEACFITQPVLSRHISAIEKELGVQLLQRTTKSVSLTDEGAIFFESAKILSDQYDHLRNRLMLAKSGYSACLKVGILQYAMPKYIVPVMQALETSDISIDVFPLDSDRICNALVNDKVNIALMFGSDKIDTKVFKAVLIKHEDTFIAMKKNNPLAKKRKITIKDLSTERFFFPSKNDINSPLITSARELCLKSGFEPNGTYVAGDADTVLLAVQNKNGITFIPSHLKSIRFPDLVFKRLSEDELPFNFYAVYKKQQSNAAILQFIECCKKIKYE